MFQINTVYTKRFLNTAIAPAKLGAAFLIFFLSLALPETVLSSEISENHFKKRPEIKQYTRAITIEVKDKALSKASGIERCAQYELHQRKNIVVRVHDQKSKLLNEVVYCSSVDVPPPAREQAPPPDWAKRKNQ